MPAYRQHTGVLGLPGETVTVAAPRRWRGDGSRVALVLAEGYTNDPAVTFRPGQLQPVVDAVTAAGFLVVNSQLGGNAFGNTTAQARIEVLIAFARATYGAHPGKVAIAGFSMGAMNVLSWAGTTDDDVACAHVWCPATDQAWMHGLPQWAPALDAAYDGWTTEDRAGHDPLTLAQAGAYDEIPLRVEYASDDATIPAARVQAFAAAAGVTAHDLGAGGHEYTQTRKPSSLAALVEALRTYGT
ncbi:esterase [Gordonia phage EMoore]|uniref:Esterase n=1 Tax=Gordonia phage EMoore TaxID=2656534 RepID=A0A649VU32_9CAUD|nr:esterase [Gordonia phage EMoore]QGJ95808.1 esterase [Gordonia phage EMoore]